MSRRQKPRQPEKTSSPQPTSPPSPPAAELRERILADFATLKVPLDADEFDAVLAAAEREHLSPLEFLARVIAPRADRRRERSIERRIREARFRDPATLEGFDWAFNAKAIRRAEIEELATGEFVRRGDNLVLVGQSGVGKSRILQGLGRRFCAQGRRVRYVTSGELLADLGASLADRTLPARLRYWSRFELLIIDEFGFDKLERDEYPQAANLFYKVVDARSGKASTALASNIDFNAWSDYLGDPPLAMAFLDRLVDGAIVMKINGRSYRAHRARTSAADPPDGK